MVQIRTFQSNLTGGEIAPDTQSRSDIVKYQTGVKRAQNTLVMTQGGLRSRSGTTMIAEAVDSLKRGQLRAFSVGSGETYVIEMGDLTARFIRDGAVVLDTDAEVTATAVSDDDPAVFTAAAHGLTNGARVFVDQIADADLEFNFYTVAAAATDTFQLVDMWGAPVGRDGKDPLASARVTPDYRIETPYAFPRADRVTTAQDQARAFMLSREVAPHLLTRVAPDEWTLELEEFQPGIEPPEGVGAAALVGTGATTYTYVVSAIDGGTGEESLPSDPESVDNDLTTLGNQNEVTWDAVPGAVRYLVYREDNGVFGYIGGTAALSFVDENITPDLSDTPQQGRNPFEGAGNYPAVGTVFEQRLLVASTHNNPGGVWGSQSANLRNFGVSSPIKESDAITFRVRANTVTSVQGLASTDVLLALAAGGEWRITGGRQEDYLTPLNPLVRQRSFHGSAAVEPLLAGASVLHVQRGGQAIREFRPDQQPPSADLTLLARHLFTDRRVVNMAYQQTPDSTVWAITDTGKLLSMAFRPEQDIWGWTSHELGGDDPYIEDIAVVEEFGVDTVYLLVRRTVNGQTKRFIERLANTDPIRPEDAYCVDCGLFLTYSEPTEVVAGLHHLEGEPVVALVDGDVVRDLTVEGGRVTLPVPGTIAAIGLPYACVIETLDLDLGAVEGAGSVLGRFKSITDVRLRVSNTRGLFVAHERPDLRVEHKQRAEEAWGEAIALYTGTIQISPLAHWSEGGNLIIEQTDPLPFKINGLLIDWEFGE